MYLKRLNLRRVRKVRVDKFFAPPGKIVIRKCLLLLVSLSVCPDGAACLEPLSDCQLFTIQGVSY